jgi:hypothetical protein
VALLEPFLEALVRASCFLSSKTIAVWVLMSADDQQRLNSKINILPKGLKYEESTRT